MDAVRKDVRRLVNKELEAANKRFPQFASPHEGQNVVREELEEADLLLHVADASHPELDMQLKAVDDILIQLELHDTPRLLVFNKVDALDEEQRALLRERHPQACLISALTRQGLEELTAAIAEHIDWERSLTVKDADL